MSLSLAARCVKLPGRVTRKRNMTHAGDVAQICCNQNRLRLSFGSWWSVGYGSLGAEANLSPHRVKVLPDARALDRDPYTSMRCLSAAGSVRSRARAASWAGFPRGPGRTPGVPRLRGRQDPAGAASGVSAGGRQSTPSGEAESTTRRMSGPGARPSLRRLSPARARPRALPRPHCRNRVYSLTIIRRQSFRLVVINTAGVGRV